MRTLILCACLLFSRQLEAATLYVNNSGSPACSDATVKASNSSGSPWCTIRRAVFGADTYAGASAAQAAAAGDTVLVTAGTYTAVGRGNRFLIALQTINEGSSGNPITIRCATIAQPAVCVTQLSSSSGPTFGSNGTDYVAWDGFYVDEVSAPTEPDTGPVVINDCTGCTITRSTVVCDPTYLPADNHTGIRTETSINATVSYNVVSNCKRAAPGNHNGACILTYTSTTPLFEFNTLHSCGAGIYLKSNDGNPTGPTPHVGTTTNGGIVRFNLIYDNAQGGIEFGQNPATSSFPWRVYQNVSRDNAFGMVSAQLGTADNVNRENRYTYFVNNTLDGNTTAGVYLSGDPNDTGNLVNLLNNNIISNSPMMISRDTSQMANTNITNIQSNIYFTFTTRFGQNTGNYATFTDWKTAFSYFDQTAPVSLNDDPDYTNAAGNDFTLQVGSPAINYCTDILDLGPGATVNCGAYINAGDCVGAACGPAVDARPIRIRKVGL